MNTFYLFPIFIPISSDSDLEVSPKILLSILIVTNAIWLFVFIIALCHNARLNKMDKYIKEKLWDRAYFAMTSLLCGAVDGIAIFVVLVYWVSTLL